MIEFVFLCEGSSDEGLAPHLRSLLIGAGVSEALARTPHVKESSVRDKLRFVAGLEDQPHLVFVHRDADSTSSGARIEEIRSASQELEMSDRVVPVVPVQEMEAWLLADRVALENMAGRDIPYEEVPRIGGLENLSRPKEVLQRVLAVNDGRRRRRRSSRSGGSFSHGRQLLLQRLDIDGPVSQLPAWQSMVQEIRQKVVDLNLGTSSNDSV